MRTIALALCVITAGLAGCGRSAPPGEDAPEATGQQEAHAPALTLEYLSAGSMAVWCAREADRADGVEYTFYFDGTYRSGRPGEVVDGPGVDAFLDSVTVVSREQDRFVVDQGGRELFFSRGACD